MAATDQTYRSQKALDIVFALSCLLMLASIIWMFAQDYYREYKTEQRQFRDVESALAQRIALNKLPAASEFNKATAEVKKERGVRRKNQARIEELDQKARELLPTKERSEQRVQSVKADLDSRRSFYDLAVEEHGAKSAAARRYKKEVFALEEQLVKQQADTDAIIDQIKAYQQQKDGLEKPLVDAETRLKKVNEAFDQQIRIAHQKQWGASDTFRSLPIIDAFASPTKIQQFTLNDLPIDYNFKYVTRFDRCTSCHKGIDRPAFSREEVAALVDVPEELESRLRRAKEMLVARRNALRDTDEADKLPDADELDISKLSPDYLTPARITEFAAHPRIDLFASPTSKHPAEKFGCTICHSGQGSGTSFMFASHTPNNAHDERRWREAHDWAPNHDWEFPMLPNRFVESSCLKCHHQVTDLISSDGNHSEAPKLLRGYNLIKEFGCFGCHEIQGFKEGRSIGPDLRTESTPPLEQMSATERARLTADPMNPPGNLRKVGPSLFRLGEKTNKEWVMKWLRAPRAFRPDTKMPHFYGLSNNNPDQLSDELPGDSQLPKDQKIFPDTEIEAVTYFLFEQSKTYLDNVQERQKADKKDPAAKAKDQARLNLLEAKGRLSDEEKKEMDHLLELMNWRQTHGPIHDLKLSDGYKKEGAAARGRKLFTERGCLACHSHEAVNSPGDGLPELSSEAQFGPNLSQIKAKLGTKPGDRESARRWLMYWIKDPHVHHPRSRMPVTHLNNDEVADVAEWLLDQAPQQLGKEWDTLEVGNPDLHKMELMARSYLEKRLGAGDLKELEEKRTLPAGKINGLPEAERKLVEKYDEQSLRQYLKRKGLEELARVYLQRQLTQSDLQELDTKHTLGKERQGTLPEDERALVSNYTEESLKYYLGKKTVGRLGCFGCHDIPGFENTKPIGVGLLDWGKKDPGKLAFEDIDAFIGENFKELEHSPGVKHDHKGKPAYDAYYAEALQHRTREGFLHEKLLEPRSYDYHRMRLWDDRSRMPQFKFARSRKKAEESEEAYHIRSEREEAEAREAVMTFVLGLVAEPIHLAYLNQPSPDRMAEIKGRQVIDKYNCGGCHLIQPGKFEIKLNPQSLTKLEDAFKTASAARASDYDFLFHRNWAGKSPASPDRLVAYAGRARYDDEEGILLTLTEALRFPGSDGEMKDIRASSTISLPPGDVVLGTIGQAHGEKVSPPTAIARDKEALAAYQKQKERERLAAYLKQQGPLGGAFADLLVVYLAKRSPKDYKHGAVDPGDDKFDDSYARIAAPPLLLGQGERTQPEWLFRFLLDPPKIRQTTVLRMPKFNMSEDEARTLVTYFAGVTRVNNPGVGLTYPYAALPQQKDFSDPIWRNKTRDYVKRVKASGAYEKRLEELKPRWQQILTEQETRLKDARSRFKDAEARAEEAKKNKKDEAAGKATESARAAWESEVKRLEDVVKASALDKQQALWEQDQAYLTDAFKLVVNRELCLSCHRIGDMDASKAQTEQGPALQLAHERLRPGWSERWLALPQRYLTYESVMPPPFLSNDKKYQDLFVGTPLEQVEAARDLLMVYPRAAEMPLNRQWLLPTATGEKK
jgi:mono/diheme cytochrome c family protein